MGTLIVLLDGAFDGPHPRLDDRNSLQTAELNYIDSIEARGSRGTTDGRPYTHLFLLELLSGRPGGVARGLIEAFGLGMEVRAGRMAFRISPADVTEGMVEWIYSATADEVDVLERRVMGALATLDALSPEIVFYEGGKGVLMVDPVELDDLPSPPNGGGLEMANLRLLESFVSSVLDGTCRTVLPWGGGVLADDDRRLNPLLEPLTVVSNSPSALGTGRYLGAEMVYVEGIPERVDEATSRIDDGNVLLHFEEIDEASHRRDPLGKVALLEQADRLLEERFPGQEDILVVIDHGTSCQTGEHLAVPVPFITDRRGMEGHVPVGRLLDTVLGGKKH